MQPPRPAAVNNNRRTSRLPRGARRLQLLRAAQDVFVAQGFHAAAMDDIADRAGVSKPVLYQHFPGKRELYLALLEEHVSELADRVAEAMGGTDDNRARVDGAVGAYYDFIDAEGEAFRLVFESDLRNDDDVRRDRRPRHPGVRRGDRGGHRRRHRRRPRAGAAARLRADRAGRDQRPVVAAAQGHGVPRRGGVAAVGAGLARHLRLPPDRRRPPAALTPFADGAPVQRVRGRMPWTSVGVSRANRGGIAHVEVKIGVQHSPRELVIDSPKTPEEIAAEVSAAMSGGTKDGLLTLVDERGRRVVVPVDRIAYVEIAQPDQRRVGFIAGAGA